MLVLNHKTNNNILQVRSNIDIRLMVIPGTAGKKMVYFSFCILFHHTRLVLYIVPPPAPNVHKCRALYSIMLAS